VKIDRIEARLVRLPLRFPFETSFGVSTHKEFLLVSVFEAGQAGYAECVADVDPYYLPETNVTALHLLAEFLAPLALSTEVAHPRDLVALFARVRGHEMAKAAVEMAAYDLLARQRGLPLYHVLGGRGGEIASGVSGLARDHPKVAATPGKSVSCCTSRVLPV
jgi:O-succinylbenzoate synthase